MGGPFPETYDDPPARVPAGGPTVGTSADLVTLLPLLDKFAEARHSREFWQGQVNSATILLEEKLRPGLMKAISDEQESGAKLAEALCNLRLVHFSLKPQAGGVPVGEKALNEEGDWTED